MENVILLGAGGHGQVVTDLLLRARANKTNCNYKPIGFLDDNAALKGQLILGLPVLGSIARIDEFEHDYVIVTIGNNRVRSRIFDVLQSKRKKIANAIHPQNVIASDVSLDKGIMICAGVVINTGTTIDKNVILNTGCTVDHHNRVGAHAHIAPGVHLGGDVCIGEGALIGIGTIVLPGCSIGEWAIIGAGSVVTQDIPPHATAVGVPARIIKIAS